MKRNVLFVLTIVIVSLLTSCGPDARYPIDEKPEVKVDKRLFGKWILTEEHEGKYRVDSDIVYMLTKEDDYQYHVLLRAKKDGKYVEDSTIAYLSKIDKEPFVNIYLKDDPGGYIFLKIVKIDADKILATSLADTMTVTSAAQVRALMTKNLRNPAFYRDTVEFSRVK